MEVSEAFKIFNQKFCKKNTGNFTHFSWPTEPLFEQFRNFPHPTTCWWGVENYDTLPSDDDDDNGDGDGGPPVLERVQV